MSRRRGPRQPRDIAALGGRIEQWRQTRTKRSPMPDELWQEATRLGQLHGVGPISRQLGVGYATLRKRVDAAQSEPPQDQAGEPGFVELSAAQLLGSGTPTGSVVELTAQDGRRLTVRLGQADRLDVLGLVATFLGQRA